MSNPRETADLLGGAWPSGTPASRDDIRDELADHLACSEDELTALGLGPAEAAERARAVFGDVEAVARQLYWLHHGRRIMTQRIVIGGLAGVCVLLAVGFLATYRQTTRTAGAVAELKASIGEAAVLDVPVRVVVRDAGGALVAGREVYVWARRIDGPPFALPDANMMWMIPKDAERQAKVTLPEAYELLVTDADGAVTLGRRPAGVYTAAVSLEPELRAGNWLDESGARALRKGEQPRLPWWVGYVQQAFEVSAGGGALEVALRVPELRRTNVRVLGPPNGEEIGGGMNGLWLAIGGAKGDAEVWLRGFERTPKFADGAAPLELPLPPRATLHMGYRLSRGGRADVPQGVVVDLPAPAAGEPVTVALPDGPPRREEK